VGGPTGEACTAGALAALLLLRLAAAARATPDPHSHYCALPSLSHIQQQQVRPLRRHDAAAAVGARLQVGAGAARAGQAAVDRCRGRQRGESEHLAWAGVAMRGVLSR